MNDDINPIVSVPVITYNSSEYVLETLESIKNQTYKNLELIICDDCSTDNTVQLCNEWLEHNEHRFVRVKVLESSRNEGVSVNGNRAEAECTGEWVKGIAGDDMLMPECIMDFIRFVIRNPKAKFIFAKVRAFGASEEYNDYFVKTFFDYSFFYLSREEQLHRLCFQQNCIPAPTFFYNRRAKEKIGVLNDERIPMLEDWPKWINLLSKGAKLDFLDKEVVYYRLREASLSASVVYSPQQIRSSAQLFILYQAKAQFLHTPLFWWFNKLCCAHTIVNKKVTFFSVYWWIYSKVRNKICKSSDKEWFF